MNKTNKEGPSSSFSLLFGLILIAGLIGTGLIIRQLGGGGETPENNEAYPARSAAGAPAPDKPDRPDNPDGIEGVQMPLYPKPGGASPGSVSPPRVMTSHEPEPRPGTVPGRMGRKSEKTMNEKRGMVQPARRRERAQRQDLAPGEVHPDDMRRLEESLRIRWEQHPEMWEHIPPEDREAAFQKYREKATQRVKERAKNIESTVK